MKYRFSNLKNDHFSWYWHPSMNGHISSVEVADSIERVARTYGKTANQKAVIGAVVDWSATDWHYYFNNYTGKDLSLLVYALRHIDRDGALPVLLHHIRYSGLLKTSLCHILEKLAYRDDRKGYERHYAEVCGWYGLKAADSRKRLSRYIQSISNE